MTKDFAAWFAAFVTVSFLILPTKFLDFEAWAKTVGLGLFFGAVLGYFHSWMSESNHG